MIIQDKIDDLYQILDPMIGLPVTFTQVSAGSIFFLGLGFASNRVNKTDPANFPHREWELFVEYGGWRIDTDTRILAACEDDHDVMSNGLKSLEGSRLSKIHIEKPALDAHFTFDNGSTLHLYAISSEDDSNWAIYGNELSIFMKLNKGVWEVYSKSDISGISGNRP